MKRFYVTRGLLHFILGTAIFLLIGQETAFSQGKGVHLTISNGTTGHVIIRRTAAKAMPFAFKRETNLPPGAAVRLRSVEGESFLIFSGRNEIAKYIATAQEEQTFTVFPAVETGSKLNGKDAQQLVEYHNLKRREAGVGPVVWSPRLAEYAQKRADTIARTKNFAHLPQGQNPYGENLAQGGSGGGVSGFTVLNACESWFAEKAKMPKGARNMTMDLFNSGVGHYTQMIWKGSTEIGAGIANFQQNGFAMTVVVCCYNPPGNFIGGTIF